MFELTDTHCHLYEEYFDDLPDVLQRMRQSGVTLALVPGYDLATSREAVALAGREPGILAAVGVHPTSPEIDLALCKDALEGLLDEYKGAVAAIGETGIDLFHNKENMSYQKQLFALHLDVAQKSHKCVIIHTRQSAVEVVGVLADAGYDGRGVFHCFDGSTQLLEWARSCGFGVSFAGNVTYKGATVLKRLVEEVPDDLILVETDSPFLTPVPVRGRRNEPMNVIHVLGVIAEAKGWKLEEAALRIRSNFLRILGQGKEAME